MSNKLTEVMKKLGTKYVLGITIFPESYKRWLCRIPFWFDEDASYDIDYEPFYYGRTALEAAEKALREKDPPSEENLLSYHADVEHDRRKEERLLND